VTLTLVLLLSACGADRSRATVRVDGSAIVIDGDRPLRAIRIDLEWDASLNVTDIVAGADAERSNLVRARIEGATARFLISDSRRIHLPTRGELARLVSTGSGAIRIVDVEGAEDGGALVDVEIAR
jgi:hypothetical protein